MTSYRHGFSLGGGARGASRTPRARRIASALAITAAALLVAACSSSGSSGSSTPSTSGAGGGSSSSSSGTSGSVDLAALSAAVDKGAAVPSFGDYGADYGGKVPNISNLRGKKIMIIPGVSALAACTEIA